MKGSPHGAGAWGGPPPMAGNMGMPMSPMMGGQFHPGPMPTPPAPPPTMPFALPPPPSDPYALLRLLRGGGGGDYGGAGQMGPNVGGGQVGPGHSGDIGKY